MTFRGYPVTYGDRGISNPHGLPWQQGRHGLAMYDPVHCCNVLMSVESPYEGWPLNSSVEIVGCGFTKSSILAP